MCNWGKVRNLRPQKPHLRTTNDQSIQQLHSFNHGIHQSPGIGIYYYICTKQDEASALLATNHASQDRLLAGDFNAHHTNWCGKKAADFNAVLRASRRQADMLVEWTSKHQCVVLNTIGTPTHISHAWPKSGTQRLTVLLPLTTHIRWPTAGPPTWMGRRHEPGPHHHTAWGQGPAVEPQLTAPAHGL